MKTKSMPEVASTEAANKFGELMRQAQRQPVKVTKRGRDSVVVVSEEEWQRVHRYRLEYLAREASRVAKERGLSLRKLSKLLEDD